MSAHDVRVGLLLRLEAKAGKAQELADFLAAAVELVRAEPQTVTWYAIRLGPSTFGIFDTFADHDGRQAHLGGTVAAALVREAPDLLAHDPVIEPVDVIAAT